MTEPLTVCVVDDDPGALRSLCWLIEQAGLPVRAFPSGQEFLNARCIEETGCLVLDVKMPDMTGLELQRRLAAEEEVELPIVFITAHGDVPSCAAALRGGAVDFLEKPVDGPILLERIREALTHCAAQRQRQRAAAELAERISRLTAREKEVLDELVAGKTLKEIAAASNVTIQTIWKHRVSIFQKLRVESDAELIRLATGATPPHL